MKLTVARRLSRALRSGEYKQTRGRLAREVDGEECNCCLGVLCRLEGARRERWGGAVYYDGQSHTLPQTVMRSAGTQPLSGGMGMGELIGMNDGTTLYGIFSFDEIADVIDGWIYGGMINEL